jgi:hypothetical protein
MASMDQTNLMIVALACGPTILSFAILVLFILLRKPWVGLIIGVLVPVVIDVVVVLIAESGWSAADSACRDAMSRGATNLCGEYLGLGMVLFPVVELIFLLIQVGAFMVLGLLSVWIANRSSHKNDSIAS